MIVACRRTAVLTRSLAPDSRAFHRMVLAEAARFPEPGALAQRVGWTRTLGMVAAIMRTRGLGLPEDALREDAEAVYGPGRGQEESARMLGWPKAGSDRIERRARRCAAIFLHGAGRDGVAPGPPGGSGGPGICPTHAALQQKRADTAPERDSMI